MPDGAVHELEHLPVARCGAARRAADEAGQPRRREQVAEAEPEQELPHLGHALQVLVPHLEPVADHGAHVVSVTSTAARSLTFTTASAPAAAAAATAARRRATSSSLTRRNDRTRRGPSSSRTQILRRRQCAPWRANARPSPSAIMTRRVGLHGRDAKLASCALRTSRAASGDEATTKGTSPSLRYMSGAPCRRARSAMARCTWGLPIRWCRLPMTGSRHGPGGSLGRPAPLPRARLATLSSRRGATTRA
ncbi:Os02g0184650, partial [Oryza sativa Japonica Group]